MRIYLINEVPDVRIQKSKVMSKWFFPSFFFKKIEYFKSWHIISMFFKFFNDYQFSND
jgi:hypothetical protein